MTASQRDTRAGTCSCHARASMKVHRILLSTPIAMTTLITGCATPAHRGAHMNQSTILHFTLDNGVQIAAIGFGAGSPSLQRRRGAIASMNRWTASRAGGGKMGRRLARFITTMEYTS